MKKDRWLIYSLNSDDLDNFVSGIIIYTINAIKMVSYSSFSSSDYQSDDIVNGRALDNFRFIWCKITIWQEYDNQLWT